MINNDRIVPITAIDLISMYGLILKMIFGIGAQDPAAVPVVLEAASTDGKFEIGEAGNFIMSEPVKICNIESSVARFFAFFVPAYDYSGFTVNGAAVTTEGDEVKADGRTLYSVSMQDGSVTITKAGY